MGSAGLLPTRSSRKHCNSLESQSRQLLPMITWLPIFAKNVLVMMQASKLPWLTAAPLHHAARRAVRCMATQSTTDMHSMSDADGFVPHQTYSSAHGSSQTDGAAASNVAADTAQHAFKGASAERRKRLRELSSPVYAEDHERKAMVDRIVRVDHSGEYSAVQIYRGQVSSSAFRIRFVFWYVAFPTVGSFARNVRISIDPGTWCLC